MEFADSLPTRSCRRGGLLALCAMLGLLGCSADLVVDDYQVTWNAANKNAVAMVANQGSAAAGPFLVYFTPEECPTSSNYRPQKRVEVAGLAAGAVVETHAEFEDLARPENDNLGNVYAVSVMVDPKQMVAESDEFNNWDSRPTQYDISGLTVHTYNEALATILRGIEITPAVAQQLEIPTGYFKISSHRVWNQPSERVIALHLYKNYYESAVGTSAPPQRDERFVFSIIDQYEYDSTGFRFTGRDFHGHTLSFDIAFQTGCHAVNSVALNCTTPNLTTQTYTTSQLYTCGVTSEPAWTDPLWE